MYIYTYIHTQPWWWLSSGERGCSLAMLQQRDNGPNYWINCHRARTTDRQRGANIRRAARRIPRGRGANRAELMSQDARRVAGRRAAERSRAETLVRSRLPQHLSSARAELNSRAPGQRPARLRASGIFTFSPVR